MSNGTALFTRACADCHGSDGEGTDAGRDQQSRLSTLASDQMLRRIIITGRPDLRCRTSESGTVRDDFKPLTSADIDQLVALLGQWRHGSAVAEAAAARKQIEWQLSIRAIRATRQSRGVPVRRTFLGWLTFAIGGVAAGLAGVPIIGYFFRTPQPKPPWVGLGAGRRFPKDETRMSSRSTIRSGRRGTASRRKPACYVRREGSMIEGSHGSWCWQWIAAHLGLPGNLVSRVGTCSCAHATAAFIMPTASVRPARRRAECFIASGESDEGQLEVRAPHFPTLQDTLTDDEQQTT